MLRRVLERLAPLLAKLDEQIDARLERTLVRTVITVPTFRHGGQGLLLSEWGEKCQNGGGGASTQQSQADSIAGLNSYLNAALFSQCKEENGVVHIAEHYRRISQPAII